MSRVLRSLLVVDDDSLFCDSIREALRSDSLEVHVAGTGVAAMRLCKETLVDIVILDQRLPDTRGPDLCPALLESNPGMKIIFVTAYPDFSNALHAIRAGAFDYLSKPVELEAVRHSVNVCLRALELEKSDSHRRRQNSRVAGETLLIGSGPRTREMVRQVELAASVDSPVLVTGETGTGKSLVARAIHVQSSRRDGEFVNVNCAALPETLIESELFGYEKGAFTGATASREGLVELAEAGTLLLDEIGDMPLALQSRLLGVLDDRSVRRVGGRCARTVDFRLIAATNSDLEARIAQRAFRADLFYRLNVVRIAVPPLRDRPEDIPDLVRHFLDKSAPTSEHLTIADDEMAALQEYSWPGNLRELRNVIDRAYLLRRGDRLMPSSILGAGRPVVSNDPRRPFEPLSSIESRHIAAALQETAGNLTRAAQLLGISVSTIRRKRDASSLSN